MNKRSAAIVLCFGLGLCGCSQDLVQTAAGLRPGDYPAILPYQSSDMRGKHVGLINDIDIRIQLEQGLMDYSKAYFSPDDVAYTTHHFLDYDELDATDGSRGLLGTLRDSNPNGLNPAADEQFDTGNGIVTGPVLISDLYELDFYSGDTLKGISIGLAVSDAAEQDGHRIEISRDKMEDYLRTAGTKIVTYMRERFNDISSDIPILIGAYQLNTDESSSEKGGYIYLEYFNGNDTSFQSIEENYILVPSAKFTELEPEMAAQFDSFRHDVSTVLSDSTYTTGEAKLQDSTVVRMTLNITTHGKTVGEIRAVIQSIRDRLSVFTSEKCSYKVIIKNNGDICALMDREPETSRVDVLSVY